MFFGDGAELVVDVAPLTEAEIGKEVLLARLAEFAAGEGVFLFVKKFPDVEVGEEVGVGVGEFFVRGVGEVALIEGTVARVLGREGGGDDEDVVEAAVLLTGEDHATDSGVDGEAGEGASCFS